MNSDTNDLAISVANAPPVKLDFRAIARTIAASILSVDNCPMHLVEGAPLGLVMFPEGTFVPDFNACWHPGTGVIRSWHQTTNAVGRPLRGSRADLTSAQRTVEAALLDCQGSDSTPLLALHARAVGVTRDAGLVRIRQSIAQPDWWTASGDDLPDGGVLAEVPPGDAKSAAWAAWAAIGCPRSARVVVIPHFGARGGPLVGRARSFEIADFSISGIGERCDDPVHHVSAISRAESARGIPDDSDSIVLALHLECTRSQRARSRVRAAWVALAQYVLEERWSSRDAELCAWVRDVYSPDDYPTTLTADQRDAAHAIAAFEAHGIGGRHGFMGGEHGMSWARSPTYLALTRDIARDDAAWAATVRTIAGEELTPRIALLGVAATRYEDLEWPMAYALDRAYQARLDPASSRAWCDVARATALRTLEPDAPAGLPVEDSIHRFEVSAGPVARVASVDGVASDSDVHEEMSGLGWTPSWGPSTRPSSPVVPREAEVPRPDDSAPSDARG